MGDRFEIAADLRAIANCLRIKGENPFKAQAYERGAAALESFEGDLDNLIKGRHLKEISGVGSALAAIIEEIYSTGECWLLQQLRDELPPGAIELSEVPGLSLKKIIALHDALTIASIVDLKAACEDGQVSKVKGFGPKSQTKLLADIEKLEKPQDGFLLLNDALQQAEKILNYLRGCPQLVQADIAGALRRRKEKSRRIIIIASSNQQKPVLSRFLAYPALARTDEIEDGCCLVRLASGTRAELVIVAPENYITTLHRRTGSRKHLAKLAGLARGKNKNRIVTTENEIYHRVGLSYIPPELREDEGEIEAGKAGRLPELLTHQDIRGMTHCHTVYSDGRNSIEEMALAAEAMGMAYLTITDHSQSAYYARGVGIDRLRAQWDEISRVQERVGIKLLKGTESDILADGSLDYPDNIIEQFDIIIASIHARYKMDADQMTKRLLRALKLPLFKIWGHPLGRLLQSRPPFDCRMEQILDEIAQSRCAIEINGDPKRLDLEPRWIRAARERGIKFIVSTDAHSIGGLGNLRYGVAMARRGWLAPDEVLNTLSVENFIQAVRP
jgi:DNA polymerase (family 10)